MDRRWSQACTEAELPEDGRRVVDIEGAGAIALFRHGGSVYALSARCPHAAGPLGHGWIEEDEVVCPLHRWRFRLSDGRCTTVRGEWVRWFRCESRDGVIWIEL